VEAATLYGAHAHRRIRQPSPITGDVTGGGGIGAFGAYTTGASGFH
jgi:hypothetical protein